MGEFISQPLVDLQMIQSVFQDCMSIKNVSNELQWMDMDEGERGGEACLLILRHTYINSPSLYKLNAMKTEEEKSMLAHIWCPQLSFNQPLGASVDPSHPMSVDWMYFGSYVVVFGKLTSQS